MKYLIVLFLFLPFFASANIYKCEVDGKPVFSDKPCETGDVPYKADKEGDRDTDKKGTADNASEAETPESKKTVATEDARANCDTVKQQVGSALGEVTAMKASVVAYMSKNQKAPDQAAADHLNSQFKPSGRLQALSVSAGSGAIQARLAGELAKTSKGSYIKYSANKKNNAFTWGCQTDIHPEYMSGQKCKYSGSGNPLVSPCSQ